MKMSKKIRKNKRVKFGLFSSELEAQAECEKREKLMLGQSDATFRTLKVSRNKEGKRSWMAYCLIPRKIN